MSILIKSMEMPSSCYDCEIRIKCGCKVANASGWLNNKIDNKCPFEFTEVSTPHGRLIDADALKKRIDETAINPYAMRGWVYAEILNAPTIIEAEE